MLLGPQDEHTSPRIHVLASLLRVPVPRALVSLAPTSGATALLLAIQ